MKFHNYLCEYNVFYVSCRLIGENKDLTMLNMAMCRGISVNGLIPILSNCRQ